MPLQGKFPIIEHTVLRDHIHEMHIAAPGIAEQAKPGQFLNISCGEARLLRRPISICDCVGERLRIVFAVHGEGTKWLAERKTGDYVDVMGPLGNGFPDKVGNTILIGGGIGVPPMLYAARGIAGKTAAILGFRSKSEIILHDDFLRVCSQVYLTTDDGSAGEKGFVTGPLEQLLLEGGWDRVFACGPRPMLKAVSRVCGAQHMPCFVSMEERMGCGIGACLVCACRTMEDGEAHMRHVCKDGPVFSAEEICWE